MAVPQEFRVSLVCVNFRILLLVANIIPKFRVRSVTEFDSLVVNLVGNCSQDPDVSVSLDVIPVQSGPMNTVHR